MPGPRRVGFACVVRYHHGTMRLIPLLTAAQEKHGHLSEPVLRDLARTANVPLHLSLIHI